jgi:hypothetical protein
MRDATRTIGVNGCRKSTRGRAHLRGGIVLAACLVLACGGCAAYRFGAASLYPPDIQTVYVPVFESDSFRRNISELLTEAVCREIEKVTPYKVVGTPDADSVLTAKLISDTKRVVIEDTFDQPREVEINMAVEVRWVNRRGDLLNEAATPAAAQDVALLSAPGNLVAEYGQSVTTAQLQSIQRLAAQIVSLMEVPW